MQDPRFTIDPILPTPSARGQTQACATEFCSDARAPPEAEADAEAEAEAAVTHLATHTIATAHTVPGTRSSLTDRVLGIRRSVSYQLRSLDHMFSRSRSRSRSPFRYQPFVLGSRRESSIYLPSSPPSDEEEGSSYISLKDQNKSESARHRSRRTRIRRKHVTLMVLLSLVMISALIISTRYWMHDLESHMGLDKEIDMNPGMLDNATVAPVRRIMAASHNDEMQGKNALTLALSLGYGYIEVDTHLGRAPAATTTTPAASCINSSSKPLFTSSSSASSSRTQSEELDPSLTLLIGHDTKDLSSKRTLQRFYLDPLMEILDRNNEGVEDGQRVGLYENDPNAEVILMIDMKDDGDAIWPYLVSALQPFLAKGYLTAYDTTTSTFSYGPLRIVGTGSTPIPRVYYSTHRYIFYDAPLLHLHEPYTIPKTSLGPEITFEWDNTLAPIASSKYPLTHYLALTPSFLSSRGKGERNPFMNNLKLISAIAKSKGIESRWWGVARNPRWLRRKMWEIQRQSGATVINGDDLRELALWLQERQDEGSGRG